MDRFDIQQTIRRSIDEQMARKWLVPPSQAQASDSYSLDLNALFQSLESHFNIPLASDLDLRRVSSINELSQYILEKTRLTC
ncbi:acyl carrier protein [Pseudomonas sp. MAFF 302030]|jgi:hypothetical protein|uniref:Acyl carrier protein n=1 Tax=Pseudomonas morbosilactucae TaxID=2938197 RepID=A0A9X2C9I2_9PSED|nr:acyl carrier protein [Pseudomonas morbosilactucae]MCK9802326.1 acyl carrier protein [Pseudomonas morbosilactucae]MCK9817330.1 acyl carrier protein [Pseudomonas morbosilactucae]WEK11233.1 MAG: acyl carrier protein [Pseudomonas sp.]